MASEEQKSRPEREHTNESLRSERDKADRALHERRSTEEDDADRVVDRARETADAVLDAARDKADQGLGPGSRRAADEERAVEDQTLRDERASADARIQEERAQAARALARLLPFEREATDRFLLTERVRADDALSNRDDFLGIVSHDLRNLLGGIVLSTDLLAAEATGTDQGKRTIALTRVIQRHSARMNRLISDLVDVASIDSGRLSVTLATADAGALVTEAVDLFRSAATAKEISLEVEHLDAGLTADLDHDRILQVLINLITNAIKFSARGAHIRLRCERAGGALRFTVRDTGGGIPEEMLEAVFQRFWQVGENDRRGLGLGLYISRCLVEAHGGTIEAASEPGAGSTFSFTLPTGT